jgi:hypothetical protein
MFTLRWQSSADFWLLEQGGNPVGAIKKAGADTTLRTAAEEWHVAVRRHRRFGWHLEFARGGEREATRPYFPRTLPRGGRLDVSGGRRYSLRSPLLRADWRLAAATGGEICRIAFRGRRAVPAFRKHVDLSANAVDEPLLPVVILAASAAIVVHDEEVVAPLPGGSI